MEEKSRHKGQRNSEKAQLSGKTMLSAGSQNRGEEKKGKGKSKKPNPARCQGTNVSQDNHHVKDTWLKTEFMEQAEPLQSRHVD